MRINLTDLDCYYINLDQDTHKKTHMQSMLTELGFNKIHRFNAVSAMPPRLGCGISHYEVLKTGLKSNKPFLVFEDDLRVRSFVSDIEVPDNADAVYLGNSIYGLFHGSGIKQISAERVDEKLYRVYNMLGAHAILYLNMEYVANTIKTIEFDIEIKNHHDRSRAAIMKYFNIYSFNEPMFYQGWQHEYATDVKLENIRMVGKEKSY